MQLKIKRSQRDGGVISKTAIFCLDARVEFTGEEKRHISRYKLGREVIYSSEAAKRHAEKGDANLGSGTVGNLKALGSFVMARLNLNISIDSLERGQHVECKSLEELMGAEEAIMLACQNLNGYLDLAATFDGREVLFDFATGAPEPIAKAIAPTPALIVDPKPQSLPLPAPPERPRAAAALDAETLPSEPPNHLEGSNTADYPTSYEEGSLGTDFAMEVGAKKALMIIGALILLFLLFKCA
jgi:hypothetical protein